CPISSSPNSPICVSFFFHSTRHHRILHSFPTRRSSDLSRLSTSRLKGVLSLSVAFTKEDSAETASETLLPDRPISPHANLVTEAGLKALEFQLQQAREAYDAAQKIEDVNERRRQAAIPARDVRYFAARVR